MTSPVERSHYEVLGVAPDATAEQIRDAHRQAARVLHPDVHVDSTEAERRLAERRMREVNGAWTVLSDPTRRAEYDRAQRVRGQSAPSGRSATAESSPSPSSAASSAADERLDEFGSGLGLDFEGRVIDGGYEYEAAGPVPQWQYWMFRRVPVIVVLLIAAVLFILTAYAGSGQGGSGSGDGSVPTNPEQGARNCVRTTTAGRSAVLVPCSAENDGHIVTKVAAALDCPTATTYVLVEDEFLCVSTDPAVVGTYDDDRSGD